MHKCQTINICKAALYIVPTPIGNFEDITYRAISILNKVDLIAAEDTRCTGILLKYFNINACLFSLHNYSKQWKIDILIKNLQQGKTIALVSDSGTPLISDPGYSLISQCYAIGLRVIPLPGACAAITALSASGLSTNRFCYEGFLPRNRKTRLNYLKTLMYEERTLIFYESKHRLYDTLQDMLTMWGPERYVVLARELTKIWESIHGAKIISLLTWINQIKTRQLGQMVILVKGYNIKNRCISSEIMYTLNSLIIELSVKKAILLTAKIYGIKKNLLYNYFLQQKNKN